MKIGMQPVYLVSAECGNEPAVRRPDARVAVIGAGGQVLPVAVPVQTRHVLHAMAK